MQRQLQPLFRRRPYWEETRTLSGEGIEIGGPNIADSQGGLLNLVYGSQRDAAETGGYNWEAYYKNSADDGATWGDAVRLTYDSIGDTRFPIIAAAGNKLHLARLTLGRFVKENVMPILKEELDALSK